MAEESLIPDEIKDFVELLKDHQVKEANAISIGKFIARTGSPQVFEKPEELADFLARYPRELAPVQRRRILEQWFAEKGVTVPTELLAKAGLHPKELKDEEKKGERERKLREGAVWTIRDGKPELAREGEPAATYDEIKKALKELAGEETIVVFDDKAGRHIPNYNSEFVKKNPMVAIATAKQYDQMLATGEGGDPFDIFMDQWATFEQRKEQLGIGATRGQPSTTKEFIDGLKELDVLRGGQQQLPEWMRDPVKFQQTVQALVPQGDTAALKEVREQLTKVRDDLHQAELKRKEDQITDLTTAIQSYRGEVTSLKQDIEKSKMITGRSAYDLIGDLIKKVPDKEDVRQMVLEAVGKGPKLLTRGATERESTLEAAATSIEAAAEVKAIEDSWFRLG